MTLILALFIPSLVLIFIRERLLKENNDFKKRIIKYLLSFIVLNLLMVLILLVLKRGDNVIDKLLNSYSFIFKYLALSIFIAILEPIIEYFMKNKLTIKLSKAKDDEIVNRAIPYEKIQLIIAIIYSIILFALNFIRIFNDNFWSDECFTILTTQNNLSEIINITAADVHPPLYYFFIKLAISILGTDPWVYRLVSLIPLLIFMILALTVLWKKFSPLTSFIFITLVSLTSNALIYNVEVRMYSWGALFVFLSFYYFYSILENKRIKDYTFFIIYSLAAAYMHYYCLISVAFFYAILLIVALFKKVELKKVLITYIITIIGYLPWFFILLKQTSRLVSDYWIVTIPGFKESILYLFSNQFSIFIYLILGIIFIIYLLYELNILKLIKDKLNNFSLIINISNIKISNNLIMIIAGLISIIGTIVFGIAISKLIRPFYVLRYIYPISTVAMFIIGFIISKMHFRYLYGIAFMAYMLIRFIPSYLDTYNNDLNALNRLHETLKISDEISINDEILTNHDHIYYTIAEIYYPGVRTSLIDVNNISSLNKDTTYWLMLIDGEYDINEVLKQITNQDFKYELIIESGNLGTNIIDIYKLSAN